MQSDSTTQSARHFRKKLKQLSIDVDGEDKPELRATSAKHIRGSQFAFPGMDAVRRKEIDDTIAKLNNLELERNSLLEELERLKEGAVSALVQKEEVIEQLKEKVERAQQCKEAMGQENQKEYTGLLAQLEMAITQVEQYKKEVETLREDHIEEVAKRDQLICELGEELEQAKLRLQDLSQSQKTLSDKYNQAQSEKQQLEDELVRSRVNLSILRESMSNSLPGASEGHDEDSQTSQVRRKQSAGDAFRFNTDESHEFNESKQKAWIDIENQEIQRLRQENNEEKERHHRQLEQLRIYYEQKLEAARSRVEAEQRIYVPFPKTQSSISVARRPPDQLPLQPVLPPKKVGTDLKKQLIAVQRLQAGRDIKSHSGSSDEEEEQQGEKSDTTSQFSSRHFQYHHQNETQKQKKVQFNEPIEQTSPNEEKDPSTFLEWVKTITLSGILMGSLLVGGVLMMFVRARK